MRYLIDNVQYGCTAATVMALALAQERSLQLMQFDTSESSAKFHEVHYWNKMMQSYLDDMRKNDTWVRPTTKWPWKKTFARIQDMYRTLWSDVFDSEALSPSLYNSKESRRTVTEQEYHDTLDDVSRAMDALNITWTVIRGTLLALARYGQRGLPVDVDDPRRNRHLLEDDIDLAILSPSAEDYIAKVTRLGRMLTWEGWDCWGKSSLPTRHPLLDVMRPLDIMYCLKKVGQDRGGLMILDMSSIIMPPGETDAFVFRNCENNGTCIVPPDVGPLKLYNGTVPQAAIRATRRCKALTTSVPCPDDIEVSLHAMVYNGKESYVFKNCIVLPFMGNVMAWDDRDFEIMEATANQLEAEGYANLRANLFSEECARMIRSWKRLTQTYK
eukprot:GEMP01050197.1.p1 GENE.GEMP01050197.1~~GEMP01050197.1.p1  ORF type:complete len:385 (+),score=83.27 GEMP01050197.1:265-1419(+)